MSKVKIGWASRDVSTDVSLNMPGQFFMRISEGVLDPLTVTALTLENEGGTAVLVSGDFIDVRSHLLDDLRSKVREEIPGLDPEMILLSATHTHTGASHVGGIGSISFTPGQSVPHEGIEIGSSDEYRTFLVGKLFEAVKESYENRVEGGIAYGYGFATVAFSRRVVFFDDLSKRPGAVQDSGHGVNGHVMMYGDTSDPMFSHYEAGTDSFVNLLFTFDLEDRLTGAVVNIPCPSQCSETERMLSADYWNEVRTAIRKDYGDIFILPQCAAAGDLSPRQLHYKEAELRRYRLKYGEIGLPVENKAMMARRFDIGEEVKKCFDEVYSWARKEILREPVVKHKAERISLPKRMVTEEEYAQAKAGLEVEKARPFVTDGTPVENLDENSTKMSKMGRYHRIIERFEKQENDRTLPMELHAIRVGDVAFASNRFEIFLDFEHRIQGRSPFVQTFIVQLAAQPELDNGSYLPTERGLWGRGFGASVYDNQVTPEAGQMIVEETVKALSELNKDE